MDKCPRILVIDDEVAVRMSLCAYLEDLDYLVSSSGSAAEALEIVTQFFFQVIVVDLRLPDMAGDLLIQKLYQLSPESCFLIHTGSSNFSITPELLEIGMRSDHIFLKPLADLAPLSQAIEELVASGPVKAC